MATFKPYSLYPKDGGSKTTWTNQVTLKDWIGEDIKVNFAIIDLITEQEFMKT
jgi:hypothetical protein